MVTKFGSKGTLYRIWKSFGNGYNKSVNGKFHDELLNCEIFETLFEAKVLIERWSKE